MKATQGLDYALYWEGPEPLNAAPTISYTTPSGGTGSATMTEVRGERSVTAIGNDRRTLTLTAGAASVYLIGPTTGRAYLITDEDGVFSVTIDRLDGTTAILADVLPRGLSLSSAATLRWAAYMHTIPAADTATRGSLSWRISYTATATPTNRVTTVQGTVQIVRRPFSTGVTHSDLVAQMPQLADMVPRRQQDLEPQVSAALEELALRVREHIGPEQSEDDIFNAEVFRPAHRYMAAQLVYEMGAQLDIAERMQQRAEELLERALKQLTLDTDDDGLIDADEIDLRRAGGSPSDVRGVFTLPTIEPTQRERDLAQRFPRWRGMQH
jgi:hypothetical protein